MHPKRRRFGASISRPVILEKAMSTVHDVAAYILQKHGQMTAMKLQKLVYYSQAWALVWDEKPLFGARIEAWANGPVVPELYRLHRTSFQVSTWPQGDAKRLTKDERETIDAVLNFYGDKSAQWLSDLTHREPPWVNARAGFAPGERGCTPITHTAMAEYYAAVQAARDASRGKQA